MLAVLIKRRVCSERAKQNGADEQEDGADGNHIPFQGKDHGKPPLVRTAGRLAREQGQGRGK
jgi:hypothetical protein